MNSIYELLKIIEGCFDVKHEFKVAAKKLDKMYHAARYPDAYPSGCPAEVITFEDANHSIKQAETIISFCERSLKKPLVA